jgi:DNA-binding XRE family transcriptional regulator
LREAAELTQPQLASRIGAHQSQLSRWEKEPGEKGYRPVPIAWAKKIATELSVDVTAIHSGDMDNEDPLPGPLKSRHPDVDQELQYAVGLLMSHSPELKKEIIHTILSALVNAHKRSA